MSPSSVKTLNRSNVAVPIDPQFFYRHPARNKVCTELDKCRAVRSCKLLVHNEDAERDNILDELR